MSERKNSDLESTLLRTGYGGIHFANSDLDGTPGDDILVGTEENDVLDGGAGSDVLIGGAGDDWLFGNGNSAQGIAEVKITGLDVIITDIDTPPTLIPLRPGAFAPLR